MYAYVFSSLRSVASVLVLATKIQEIPEMLESMTEFLRNEPEENFSNTSFEEVSDVPLTLNDKAIASFKKKTEKFPGLYATGKAGQHEFNFLYVLGQLLTNAAMVFGSKEAENPELTSPARKFYAIWGSHREMNARNIVHKFAGRKTGDTKRALILRMTASVNVMKKEVLPLL
jgi:hypothetical protein